MAFLGQPLTFCNRMQCYGGFGQAMLTALIPGRPHCTEGTGIKPDSVLNGKRTLLLDPLKSTVGKCFVTL